MTQTRKSESGRVSNRTPGVNLPKSVFPAGYLRMPVAKRRVAISILIHSLTKSGACGRCVRSIVPSGESVHWRISRPVSTVDRVHPVIERLIVFAYEHDDVR